MARRCTAPGIKISAGRRLPVLRHQHQRGADTDQSAGRARREAGEEPFFPFLTVLAGLLAVVTLAGMVMSLLVAEVEVTAAEPQE